MMKCNSYLSTLEAKCCTARMKYKVDGHEADIVNGVLMYYWAVIVTGLKTLDVGGDVRASREAALINTFLVDLVAIIGSIRVAGSSSCRWGHWHSRPCLSVADICGRRQRLCPELVVPAVHNVNANCDDEVSSNDLGMDISEVDILSMARRELRPDLSVEGSADHITHVDASFYEVEIWRGWQPDRHSQISARAPIEFLIGPTRVCVLDGYKGHRVLVSLS